ncbi:hypothetical protein PPROV_000318900 [Pycnococcus provasolii]|uniref:Cyclic nucleotide-binding domain-containing protein n=1 Tax=Pycnococcus provasolii TaxID=41880 RepID=A0A830HBQ8_9CHLO|nr:hypothetical protein PPROV_000318900 [Pycnococcus provasolii]
MMMADHHHTPAAAQVSGAQVTEKRISDTGATVDTLATLPASSRKVAARRKQQLRRFVAKRHRTRILRFFENTWRTRKLFSERDLLAELPPNLRTDIAMNICGDLVEKVPLFKVVNPVVAMMLVPLMEPVSLMTGELVYREKEIADEMFFISRI